VTVPSFIHGHVAVVLVSIATIMMPPQVHLFVDLCQRLMS
jgi:hypothetical protein